MKHFSDIQIACIKHFDKSLRQGVQQICPCQSFCTWQKKLPPEKNVDMKKMSFADVLIPEKGSSMFHGMAWQQNCSI